MYCFKIFIGDPPWSAMCEITSLSVVVVLRVVCLLCCVLFTFAYFYLCGFCFVCVALLGAWFDNLAVPRPITINFSGNPFGWNSALLVLTSRVTALQQIITNGNYVGCNPGRDAAKRFLHSIESLRFATIQVKRFRRQWNIFSSILSNYEK